MPSKLTDEQKRQRIANLKTKPKNNKKFGNSWFVQRFKRILALHRLKQAFPNASSYVGGVVHMTGCGRHIVAADIDLIEELHKELGTDWNKLPPGLDKSVLEASNLPKLKQKIGCSRFENDDDNEVPVWRQNDCNHPQHVPPANVTIPRGKRYRHVCPGCKNQMLLRNRTFQTL